MAAAQAAAIVRRLRASSSIRAPLSLGGPHLPLAVCPAGTEIGDRIGKGCGGAPRVPCWPRSHAARGPRSRVRLPSARKWDARGGGGGAAGGSPSSLLLPWTCAGFPLAAVPAPSAVPWVVLIPRGAARADGRAPLRIIGACRPFEKARRARRPRAGLIPPPGRARPWFRSSTLGRVFLSLRAAQDAGVTVPLIPILGDRPVTSLEIGGRARRGAAGPDRHGAGAAAHRPTGLGSLTPSPLCGPGPEPRRPTVLAPPSRLCLPPMPLRKARSGSPLVRRWRRRRAARAAFGPSTTPKSRGPFLPLPLRPKPITGRPLLPAPVLRPPRPARLLFST